MEKNECREGLDPVEPMQVNKDDDEKVKSKKIRYDNADELYEDK